MRTIIRRTIAENIVLVCLAIVFFSVSWSRLGNSLSNVFASDPNGYYMYLPAVFVYKDIHHVPKKLFVYPMTNEKGETFTKYTCGVAYFYLPFFLAAHLYAHMNHLDTMGFSAPYCVAIIVCGVFWAFIGLYVLKRLLLRYFTPLATWVTLLSIMFGTNFFNYATLEIGMSHVYNFTLFAAIILATDQYYKNPKKSLAIIIGILAGWIILTRPTNATLLIFLFLYRVVTYDDLKNRMHFYRQHYGQVLLAIPFAIAVMIPQMIYWKEMTGQWIKFSYVGESFIYWAHPKILEVLFDTQNGLFLYAPALLFMFWAIIACRKDPRISLWGMGIVFVIITYLFASWHAWWFGGAYGHRCYVDYFPVFAFPMAVTMERIIALRSWIIRIIFMLILILLCYYTVSLCGLYLTIGIFDGSEWRWNWDSWLGLIRKIF